MANTDLNEEQDEQEEQEKQQQRNSGNVVNRVSDSANNFSKNAQNVSNRLGEGAAKFKKKADNLNKFAEANQGTTKGVQAAAKAQQYAQKAQKMAQTAQKVQKTAQAAQKFAQLAAHLATWLIYVLIVIIIIMIIVGLLTFLITGWGMLTQAFKKLVEGFFDACRNLIFNNINGAERNIEDEEIVDVMKNIESMGYDLYGYGFVASGALKDVTTKNDNGETKTSTEMVYYEAPEEEEDGEPKLLKELENKDAYRYITAYMISDNYAYFIKNHNFNFRAMTTDAKHFLGGIFDRTEWGSGLISIYEQVGDSNSITGKRGKAHGTLANDIEEGAALGAVARWNDSLYWTSGRRCNRCC